MFSLFMLGNVVIQLFIWITLLYIANRMPKKMPKK
jgi:hypothetical protein